MRFAGANTKARFEVPLQKSEVERLNLDFKKDPSVRFTHLYSYDSFLHSDYQEMKTIFPDFEEHAYNETMSQKNKRIPRSALLECNVPLPCLYSSKGSADSCNRCQAPFFKYMGKCVPQCHDKTYAKLPVAIKRSACPAPSAVTHALGLNNAFTAKSRH